jgi:hypothetical protein
MAGLVVAQLTSFTGRTAELFYVISRLFSCHSERSRGIRVPPGRRWATAKTKTDPAPILSLPMVRGYNSREYLKRELERKLQEVMKRLYYKEGYHFYARHRQLYEGVSGPL